MVEQRRGPTVSLHKKKKEQTISPGEIVRLTYLLLCYNDFESHRFKVRLSEKVRLESGAGWNLMKTAKAFGLTIPESFLQGADKVIE